MTEHLVSSGTWSDESRLGLPRRSQPVTEQAPHEESAPEQGEESAPAARAWTRSDRGWSPTSWRLGVR